MAKFTECALVLLAVTALLTSSFAGPISDAFGTTQAPTGGAQASSTLTYPKHNPDWFPSSSRTVAWAVSGSVSNVNTDAAGKWHAKTAGSSLEWAKVSWATYSPAEDVTALSSFTVTGDSGTNAHYDKLLLGLTDGTHPNNFLPDSYSSTSATWTVATMLSLNTTTNFASIVASTLLVEATVPLEFYIDTYSTS